MISSKLAVFAYLPDEARAVPAGLLILEEEVPYRNPKPGDGR